MLPNWLGVGVGRSGTTTLASALQRHPQIYLPPAKEAHFFDVCLDPRPIDLARYEATFFSDWAGQPSVGEFTPTYLVGTKSVPRVFGNILSALGRDTKFVVSFRHPVRRAYSHHRFLQKSLLLAESFASGVENGGDISDDVALSHSFYGRAFEQMLSVVPRDNVFVIIFEEDIAVNLSDTLDRLQAFLGVEPVPEVSRAIHINRIVTPKIVFFKRPGVATLSPKGGKPETATREVPAGTILMRTGWRPWDRILVNPSPLAREAFVQLKSAFSKELTDDDARALLESHYAADVSLLETLIGRDLGCWRT